MLTIQRCTLETMETIYKTKMPDDFPAAEIKPFSKIKRMYQDGAYFAYGLYDASELVGYAFFCISPEKDAVLLDYLAISAEHRNKGYGAEFLKKLCLVLSDFRYILLEVDDVAHAKTDAELKIRKRRIGFYQRCGAQLTTVRNIIFGCPFQVLYFPLAEAADNNTVLSVLKQIYTIMLTPEQFMQNADFFIAP